MCRPDSDVDVRERDCQIDSTDEGMSRQEPASASFIIDRRTQQSHRSLFAKPRPRPSNRVIPEAALVTGVRPNSPTQGSC